MNFISNAFLDVNLSLTKISFFDILSQIWTVAILPSHYPPVGTKGYRFEQVPPGKPHWPISGSHVHFYEVNQSPVYKGCGCFWHNLNETVASDSPPKGMVNIKNNPVRGGGIRYD
jgi:hypothetical protein